jgi:hypothetical protein
MFFIYSKIFIYTVIAKKKFKQTNFIFLTKKNELND